LGLTFAFTAGVFSLFSPCGFPMLLGYISYYMGAKASLGKAITSGFVCVLGLLTVFSVIGIIVSLLGSFISRYALFLELIVGYS